MPEIYQTQKTFTPLAIWAMSFGCCVGWGAFVLPGSIMLPSAGPLGAALALVLGAFVMIVIAANYHFLAQRYPGPGGPFFFVRAVFGADHAFLCAWFLWLVYAAIIWANASALTIISSHFLGPVLKFGFHYTLAGSEIYAGEILCTSLVLIAFGLLCLFANRLAVIAQIVFVFCLLAGALICFFAVCTSQGQSLLTSLTPPFMPNNENPALQVIRILALAPWAYVGFEAVSHLTKEVRLNRKRLFGIMTCSLLTAALVYVLFLILSAMPIPDAADWRAFALGRADNGIVFFPMLRVVRNALGEAGVVVLGLAVLGAVGSGLLGFYIALSRLTAAIAADGILPKWFAVKSKQGIPRNAFLFIIAVSLIMPFVGRTAIIWIVDITSICATIAYTYVSICAFLEGKRKNRRVYTVTGALGIAFGIAVAFFTFMPSLWSIPMLASESYCIFSIWGILGFVFFLSVFRRDSSERYGQATFVWLAMLFFIFVSSLMWMRQEAHNSAETMLNRASAYYNAKIRALAHSPDRDADREALSKEEKDVVAGCLNDFNSHLIKHSLIQMLLIFVSIGVVFSAYSLIHMRRRKVEIEKLKAEEINRSKSAFLSSMSHDIRTPMNAIIGFTDLALTRYDIETVHEYLGKIKLSCNHLLSLINDVLEMSRIESGKVELHPAPVSIPDVLHDLNAIIIGQVESKQQTLDINALNVRNENILCDKLRLNQILLNLLSNAIKYTPSGGRISVNFSQFPAKDGFACYEVRVKDNGLGMSKEFAARIFESFTRENTSHAHTIQGTGLGMAITKNLVDLMGGTITVETEKGKGSEFIVTFTFPTLPSDTRAIIPQDLKGTHTLVVDDDYSACDGIIEMLTDFGVRAEWSLSGKEAILRCTSALKRGDPFMLCIIDWKLPDISGISVVREIMALHGEKKPKIILVTAYEWQNIKDEAIAAGVNVFCNKPVFASELNAAVLAAVESHDYQAKKEREEKDVAFTGRRILLVEDVEVNREIAVAMLTMNGIEVEEACNGQEAVQKVGEAEPGYYDLVLMDIQMPVMDGYAATRAIRALDGEQAHVPIIAMTANAFDEDKKAALASGMNGHLTKPITIEKLLETVQEVF
ncbi:MAG: amino acid permease [Desulfovibrionaceae bacterium]|nr:amino acid permease [Desulfovibrionaceae bacterium]